MWRRWFGVGALAVALLTVGCVPACAAAPRQTDAASAAAGVVVAEEARLASRPPEEVDTPAAAAESVQVFSGLAAQAHVRQLAGTIGSRPAGSVASTEAATYIAETLAAYGYSVERQPFTFPQFEERSVSLGITPVPGAESGPRGGHAVAANAMMRSGSGSVSARVVFAGVGRPEDFPPGGLGGAIALIERGAQITFRDKVQVAARAGAAGVIIYNNLPHTFTGSLQLASNLPVVAISGDDGQRLRLQAEQGVLRARLEVDAGIDERATENVIATLRAPRAMDGAATDPPSRTILVGAHYDSVQAGPGANDNASGTAVLLELARVLATEPMGVTLKFVAFGAEEVGLLGSAHYVSSLTPSERGQVVAMLNFDMVGVGDELLVGGDVSIMRWVDEVSAAQAITLRHMGGDLAGRSDHASFTMVGIPSAFFHVAEDLHYHTPADVVENVSAVRLEHMGSLGAQVIRRLAGS